ncbi:MAG: CBS domain-containing protein [Ardenticatenales bacterium]|nr:CBS domain-containing protein [Ardenticatenales bacterium]
MGTHDVSDALDGDNLRRFTRRLLADLRALETMIDGGQIETCVRRIGAEQEVFLVDAAWRPALAGLDVLARTDDPHFTTELGLFNVELNLDPQIFTGDALAQLERQLDDLFGRLRAACAQLGVRPILVGSLPTMRKSDVGPEAMTPVRRYALLGEALHRLRGGHFDFHIKGIDELIVTHDSFMLEACNASFQVHFQVDPAGFANAYNVAQVVAAPVLAVGANAPLLFGRRLWHETRIALFQQSIDTRSSADHLRERSPRVTFGNRWVDRSVLELYREDVVRFRALLGEMHDEDPFAELAAGRVPRLRALSLHNSTVYRWNRACYGVTDGKPHLRIENRVLPSGPTVVDEIANAALWLGLVTAITEDCDDVRRHIAFADAKANFFQAAQHGLNAQLQWLDGETVPAAELVADRLVPLAASGLRAAGIDAADIDRLLGIIHRRATSGQNGARWQLRSLAGLDASGRGTPGERLNALVGAMAERQEEGTPVAEWAPAALDESGGWQFNFLRVEQYMTTDLFTVHEDESVDLVANLMVWQHVRHVPVEDNDHRLIGMVSYRALVDLVARARLGSESEPPAVRDIMRRDLVTCGPETSTLDAIRLMHDRGVGALPVVKDGQLVGMITQYDFLAVARDLLTGHLAQVAPDTTMSAATTAAPPASTPAPPRHPNPRRPRKRQGDTA